MFVMKRDGYRKEAVKFDKVITARIQKLVYGLSEHVDTSLLPRKLIEGIYDGVTTTNWIISPLKLQRRWPFVILTTLHLLHVSQWATCIKYQEVPSDTHEGFAWIYRPAYRKSRRCWLTMFWNHLENRDFAGFHHHLWPRFRIWLFRFQNTGKILSLKLYGKVAERPQHMIMRVAVGIHKNDLESVVETHNLMSERWFYIHATPTLLTPVPKPQLSSFLSRWKKTALMEFTTPWKLR